MGSTQPREKVSTKEVGSTIAHLNANFSGEESAWEEYVETHQCCGVSVEMVRRSRFVPT
jgi:molybdopterin converting factor small subunit